MGERLGLRPLQSEDAQFLFKWDNDPKVMGRFGSPQAQFCISMEDERQKVIEMMKKKDAKHFLLLELKGNEPIGLVSLIGMDGRRASSEMQILVGEADRWGEGYCKEAVKLLTQYAFRVLNLHRLFAKVPASNDEVIRCFLECGFNVEGRLRHDHYLGGEWRDTMLLGLLVNELGGD